MTVASEVNRSGPYQGNGVAKIFVYDFRIVDASHLRVVKTNASGVETTLVLTTDYAVSGVGADSGNITTTVAPVVGETITIARSVPFTQETDLENQGAYYAETVEDALDLAAMRDQELEEGLSRSIKRPVSDDGDVDMTLPPTSVRANKYLSFDEDGRPVSTTFDIDAVQDASAAALAAAIASEASAVRSDASAAAAAGSASAAAMSALEARQQIQSVIPSVIRFSGDSSTTTFNLGIPGLDEKLTNVFVSGVYQQKDTYDVVSGVLTFSSAPPTGSENIEVNIGGTTAQAFAIPSDATVTPAKTTWLFETVASVQSTNVPAFVGVIDVQSYAVPGDGGGAKYSRVSAMPSHLGRIQSLNGFWFEMIETAPSVKAFGAKGDGVTQDKQAFINGCNYLNARGGGTLTIPAGTFITEDIPATNKVKLLGVFGSTILKLQNNGNRPIVVNYNSASNTSVNFFGLEGIIFDGNADNFNTAMDPKSAVDISVLDRFVVKNCIFRNATGYGLSHESRPGTAIDGPQTNIYLENVWLLGNGRGTTTTTDTFDGLDIKDVSNAVLISVYAEDNYDTGIDIRGREVVVIGGHSKRNGNFGYDARVETGSGRFHYFGCYAEQNGFNNVGYGEGFYCRSVVAGDTNPLSVTYTDCVARLNLNAGINTGPISQTLTLIVNGGRYTSNVNHGIYIQSSTIKSAQINGPVCENNGGSGLLNNGVRTAINGGQYKDNGRYGIEESTAATRNSYGGAGRISGNALGAFLANGVNHHWGDELVTMDLNSGTNGDIIASAATITLPVSGKVFFITGTTNITNMTISRRGRMVTLVFSAALTFTDGGNLLLNGNFVTSSADTITLVSDGTNWCEVSRSPN